MKQSKCETEKTENKSDLESLLASSTIPVHCLSLSNDFEARVRAEYCAFPFLPILWAFNAGDRVSRGHLLLFPLFPNEAQFVLLYLGE